MDLRDSRSEARTRAEGLAVVAAGLVFSVAAGSLVVVVIGLAAVALHELLHLAGWLICTRRWPDWFVGRAGIGMAGRGQVSARQATWILALPLPLLPLAAGLTLASSGGLAWGFGWAFLGLALGSSSDLHLLGKISRIPASTRLVDSRQGFTVA